jgi:LPXTG-motif cell wall-anchored protein
VYVPTGGISSTWGMVFAVCLIFVIPGLIIFMRKKKKDENENQ